MLTIPATTLAVCTGELKKTIIVIHNHSPQIYHSSRQPVALSCVLKARNTTTARVLTIPATTLAAYAAYPTLGNSKNIITHNHSPLINHGPRQPVVLSCVLKSRNGEAARVFTICATTLAAYTACPRLGNSKNNCNTQSRTANQSPLWRASRSRRRSEGPQCDNSSCTRNPKRRRRRVAPCRCLQGCS